MPGEKNCCCVVELGIGGNVVVELVCWDCSPLSMVRRVLADRHRGWAGGRYGFGWVVGSISRRLVVTGRWSVGTGRWSDRPFIVLLLSITCT